jgi:ComF family protein
MYESMIDLVLPRRERRKNAETLRPEDLEIEPESNEMLGQSVTTLARYEALRDPIQALKYDRSVVSAALLASVLADYLRDDIAEHKKFSQKPVLLIPIPLDAKRKRDRGYNQIGMVIDALPQEFKDGTFARIAAPILERTRATRQQTKLVRAARLSNVAGAFAVTDPTLLENTRVYLIDDVATTGATLVNAGNPLRHAGADVTLLALCRA